MDDSAPIVLASASRTRHRLLLDAGLHVVVDPADIDETLIKASCRAATASADEAARQLAAAKAAPVSRRRRDAVVIAADQILECEGHWFDKPIDAAAAREALRILSGRRHDLVTAVVVARAGTVEWHHVERARLTMRAFGDRFLDQYCRDCGDDLTTTVGAYRMEGLGVQLFSTIEGNHFTILGLPLLPLFAYLRKVEVLPQ